MDYLITIVRNSYLAMLAGIGLAVGIGMLGYSVLSGPPSRASLQTVEGSISEASRVTRTSRRTRSTSTYYELTLKPTGGAADMKLRIPSVEIGETDVRSIIGRPVRAEFDSEQDVYVLTQGTREVLTFANTLERRKLSFRQYYVDGIALVIFSSLLGLLGLFLGHRRLRKQAAAGGAAPPQG
jgi:hypothetical protein